MKSLFLPLALLSLTPMVVFAVTPPEPSAIGIGGFSPPPGHQTSVSERVRINIDLVLDSPDASPVSAQFKYVGDFVSTETVVGWSPERHVIDVLWTKTEGQTQYIVEGRPSPEQMVERPTTGRTYRIAWPPHPNEITYTKGAQPPVWETAWVRRRHHGLSPGDGLIWQQSGDGIRLGEPVQGTKDTLGGATGIRGAITFDSAELTPHREITIKGIPCLEVRGKAAMSYSVGDSDIAMDLELLLLVRLDTGRLLRSIAHGPVTLKRASMWSEYELRGEGKAEFRTVWSDLP